MIKYLKFYALVFGVLAISAHQTIASPPVTEEDIKNYTINTH